MKFAWRLAGFARRDGTDRALSQQHFRSRHRLRAKSNHTGQETQPQCGEQV